MQNVRDSITKNLDQFKTMSADEIFNERKNKFLRIGRNKGFINNLEDLSSLKPAENKLTQIWKSKKKYIISIILGITVLVFLINFL